MQEKEIVILSSYVEPFIIFSDNYQLPVLFIVRVLK